jgi:hypothetical protein
MGNNFCYPPTHSLDGRHIRVFECRIQVDMIRRAKKLWLSECNLLLGLSSVNHIKMCFWMVYHICSFMIMVQDRLFCIVCDIWCMNGWWLIDVCAQLQDTKRGGDILVATLGWLNDLLEKVRVSLSMVHYLALDEADMGFEIQIHIIFFWWKSATNDGFCPNLSLCYGIGAHMNNLIVQQNIILICVTLKHHSNCSKRT